MAPCVSIVVQNICCSIITNCHQFISKIVLISIIMCFLKVYLKRTNLSSPATAHPITSDPVWLQAAGTVHTIESGFLDYNGPLWFIWWMVQVKFRMLKSV